MSENMNEKYQQYYNKILTGTLTDTLLKSISFQANIQLANEIIAEQEKTIQESKENSDGFRKDLDSKITTLENQIKTHVSTINKLQVDLFEANKLRTEYENVKHQVQHIDTFRNDLIKAREQIKNLQVQHDKTIEDLKKSYEDKLAKFEEIKTPTKKKATKVTKVPLKKVAPIKTIEVEQFKDGGSF